MMEIIFFELIFILLVIAMLIYFFFSFFTTKGQEGMVKNIFSVTEIKEVIDLGQCQFKSRPGINLKQNLRLYRCHNDNVLEDYFVLETTQMTFGSISRRYSKLTKDSISKINSIYQS